MPLEIFSSAPDAASAALSASFGAAGGSIGRGEGCTLTLPDPERRISRRQAEIEWRDGGYLIRNVGSGNVIMVGTRTLAPGESMPLRAGESLTVGGYLLHVKEEGGDEERTTFAAEFTAPASTGPGRRGLGPGDRGGLDQTSDPFANLLGPAPAAASPPAVATASGQAILPDDFDPFAAPAPRPASTRASPAVGPGGFEDLIAPAPSSLDQMFGLGAPAPAGADPLASFLADIKPASAPSGKETLSADPLALFGSPADRVAAPLPEHAPDQVPELRAAFMPPRPRPAATAAPPKPGPALPPVAVALPAERTVPPGWTPDAIAVWNTLCEGAGVRIPPPPNTGPQFLRVVGMIMRAAVEGTVQLMAVRHATRQELHAQVTQIQPKNNNPLKFAPDGLSALEQLLQPAVRGFLPGPAAMTDAMNDLLGHAIGTMAGTRAALEGVLGRFAPEQLEAKLSGKSVLDNLVPAARKAKLWDLYLLHYEALRDEAQEDFHALFGKAFLAAYEQQLDRLKREKAAAAARGAPSR